MLPFLLITTRDDARIAAEEHASYCTLTGLLPEDLEWLRVDQQPLQKINFEAYSGIILAGSPFTISEPTTEKSAIELRVERDLAQMLDEVVANDFPFLGICYGIGTIGLHQGATVDKTYGEPSQSTMIHLSELGQADPLFSELPSSFAAFVGHKEAITQAPPHMAILASSAACPVQAFRVGDRVYATQFHPELDTQAFSDRVRTYAQHGYFDPEETELIVAQVKTTDVRASHLVLARFVEEFATSVAWSQRGTAQRTAITR